MIFMLYEFRKGGVLDEIEYVRKNAKGDNAQMDKNFAEFTSNLFIFSSSLYFINLFTSIVHQKQTLQNHT